MVDRGLTEPLLPADERASASPPSPRRQSEVDGGPDRSASSGSNTAGQLSAALRELNRIPSHQVLLPGIVQQKTKTISVFYWSDYDSGVQSIYAVEVTGENTVTDLIEHSLAFFAGRNSLRDTQEDHYLLRAADKKSHPKTHFPAFGLDRKVIDTGVSRFSLCHKTLDEKAKRKLDDSSEESQSPLPPINDPEATPSTVIAKKTKKRSFLCCFTSSE